MSVDDRIEVKVIQCDPPLHVEKTAWVIMTQDRKFIAKGTPRDRWLIPVDDQEDQKRYLTYQSKGRAESAFKVSGFFNCTETNSPLEAVRVKMIIEEIP